MAALARFVTGRRTKWWVIVAWVVGVAAFAPLASKLGDVTSDDFASFLPKGTESTQVQNLLRERFAGGETGVGIIVYRHRGGLTAADKAKIAADAQALGKAIPVVGAPVVPFGATPGLVSRNGEAAYTVLTVPADFQRAADWGT